MGLLDKLFGGRRADEGADVESAVSTLATMYSDPEVKAEGGISITGRQAEQIRALGRKLYRAGGKQRMEQVRDQLRTQHPWAVANLENIWSSLPEWRG